MDLGRAEQLGNHFLKLYGLSQKGWVFGWNNRKRSLGVCKYGRGRPGGRVELNQYWTSTANEVDVIDTIKHECAHALVGRGHGHDNAWKAMCIKVGCDPKARADEDVSGEMDSTGAKYFAQCGSCEQKFYKFRKPKYLEGSSCRKCGPELGKIKWQPMTPAGMVVRHPTSLAEMGLDKTEIAELNKFARSMGKEWREHIVALWSDEDVAFDGNGDMIYDIEEKIRPYLNSIQFKFHMEPK
jgi:predicted SprT family Zn-dependent metalloprotease